MADTNLSDYQKLGQINWSTMPQILQSLSAVGGMDPKYLIALGTLGRSPYSPNPPGYVQPSGGIWPFDGGGGGKKKPADPAPKPTATGATGQQNLYGFDPLQIANLFNQVFAPYLERTQKDFQGDIANYGAMAQQNMQNLPAPFRQAYSVSVPAMQQALRMENRMIPSQIAGSAATDSLIQNLTAATNAAKAAGQYASIAPYYSSMIQGQGIIGGGQTPTNAQPLTTPFTYGSPSTAALQTLQAQQQLAAQAQRASGG
jgi:hypothetical protein